MSILDSKLTIDGLGTFTNIDIINYYDIQHSVDEVGNLIHIKYGTVVGHLGDYRKKFMADMKKAANRLAYQSKQQEYVNRMMPIWVDSMLEDLRGNYGDRAFINRTQPNVEFKELGLTCYIICGMTNRVSFAHKEFTGVEMANLIDWKSTTFGTSSSKQFICNNAKTSADVMWLINQMVSKISEHYGA